jgi:uncharacterized membrane protein HdeD (DUF308 family)
MEVRTMSVDQGLKAPNPLFAARFAGVTWQAIVLRGLIGVGFGLLAVFSPVTTALSLVIVFSIYLMADGLLAIVSAFKAARQRHAWGLVALEGLASIAASVAIFVYPGLGMAVFAVILAVWSLFAGGVKLAVAMRREPVAGRGWLIASALISLLFGLALLLAPLIGAVVLTWWLGVYAIVFGAALLALGLQVRALRKRAG